MKKPNDYMELHWPPPATNSDLKISAITIFFSGTSITFNLFLKIKSGLRHQLSKREELF